MLAATPFNQIERLAAIRRYDLGTQHHSGVFDGMVELAAQICDCPIALVSIVHEADQRFEARCGVDLDSTALDSSICSHAILQEDLLEIPDTRLDPRTRDNPLVTNPDDPLRFYAGAQIVTNTGIVLGTLCVLDRVPRTLSKRQRRGLEVLAGQIMRRLELHEAMRQQDVLRREVDHRVKNSLANVTVLTRMAARQAVSEETRTALASVERRIQVMVELHADLYQTDEPEKPIALDGYLGRITRHLQAAAPSQVELIAEFEPLSLVSRQASALGVLVNELASNSCKHAFPDGRAGQVHLRGAIEGGNRYIIICEDDGIGQAAQPPLGERSGLGLRIMQASATQLGGELKLSAGPTGYRGVLEFPLSGL
ncbi:histidine kinase dimerization/phosphoacceptor domain -containing protein [uncultured Jannaschia sp.]|uniref:histidine kinase dimerization/phosphoacceptor domain -containing protein n=1 Tax=uncultured Jannaschia sp. TaxID=293347 RepID=UPI00262BC8E3|nr:histidine kinase dimerization/phosphoacceptor domain -containing protein [uncultured Jannaschia sp.]